MVAASDEFEEQPTQVWLRSNPDIAVTCPL
jgi:hypothetical protein